MIKAVDPEKPDPPQTSAFPVDFLADLGAMLRFFSRIPMPELSKNDDPARPPDFSRQTRMISIAGFILALPSALILFVGPLTTAPAIVISILAATLMTALTGALHEDGLADVADGFFGATSTPRRLEIMKDSRIGTFAAMALIIAFTLQVTLLADLLKRHGGFGAALLFICAQTVSRFHMAALWRWLPSARPDGLAARFGSPTRSSLIVAGLSALVMVALACLVVPPLSLLSGVALSVICLMGFMRLAKKKIGGQTGDALGAVQQLTYLALLLGAACVA